MAAMFTGRSCIEAVFKTTRRHSSFDATPSGASRAISCAARTPMGVAALPSPKRFALTFAESGCIISCLPAHSGKSLDSSGRSAADSRSASPETCISSITAHHRHTAPPMARHSSNAARPPSSAAAATSRAVPTAHPNMTDTTIMTVHMTPINIYNHPTILLIFCIMY